MVGPYIKIRLYMHVFVFNLLLIRDDLFFCDSQIQVIHETNVCNRAYIDT